ncbi:MaoC family dehydratase [Polyangium mundeleinium]|uniref:MaoC family dehydratase n=1 Tax=Polyangium mundeleinium TaxID=2995306 RepID=A0ABT5F621_9BACT|nr:MaoC family dehydratase [Polyangium mundeleinium]MDC0749401.1 MaoC family dehydratase [Polyangium mundeleinium]
MLAPSVHGAPISRMLHTIRYGRLFDDFVPGSIYAHPWEVTVDEGMLAFFAASFQDAIPTYASRRAARELGLRDRPVHPLLLLNLGLSFSVHDVSEQAIAHVAYMDVRFPNACYPGDTVVAASRVIGTRPVSTGDKGVVHVRTEVSNQDGEVVCSFERKVLVRVGKVAGRAAIAPQSPVDERAALSPKSCAPAALLGDLQAPRRAVFPTFWDDFEVGDVYAHEGGRTVSEAEHMQLTTLFRNSHPMHVDERYCQKSSFAKTRVVFGGLVLAWVLSLSSRDTAGNAVWDLGLDDGAHPSGVLAGDTLYAASSVVAKEERGRDAGVVVLRVIGLKNTPARILLERGADLFSPELGKTAGRVPEKAVEITRTLLVRRRT